MVTVLIIVSGVMMATSVICVCKAANYTNKKELYKRNVMNNIGIACGVIGLSLFGLVVTGVI